MTLRQRAAGERLRHEDELGVRVELMNDEGERWNVLAFGATADEAVAAAEDRAGGSWVMNEWRAA